MTLLCISLYPPGEEEETASIHLVPYPVSDIFVALHGKKVSLADVTRHWHHVKAMLRASPALCAAATALSTSAGVQSVM